MITNLNLPLCAIAASATLLLGCLDTEGATESIDTVEQAALSANALSANALSANALSANALTANALTSNALSANALSANSLTAAALEDPLSRTVLKYIVGCALPAQTRLDITVDGVSYSYEGQLGLAPEWGAPGGSCDASCQGWVSACLLARLDFVGQSVPISLRGAKPSLAISQFERTVFTAREATYYGNVFRDPSVQLACLAPGRSGIPRVCGPSLDGCAVQVVGACNQVCDPQAPDGSYPNCRDHAKVNGHFPLGTEANAASLTVFLKP